MPVRWHVGPRSAARKVQLKPTTVTMLTVPKLDDMSVIPEGGREPKRNIRPLSNRNSPPTTDMTPRHYNYNSLRRLPRHSKAPCPHAIELWRPRARWCSHAFMLEIIPAQLKFTSGSVRHSHTPPSHALMLPCSRLLIMHLTAPATPIDWLPSRDFVSSPTRIA